MLIFFDFHGGAHVTCDPSHPEARAFGPSGSSREATEADLAGVGLEVQRGVTDYTAAWRAGRLVRGEGPHEFDTLAETTD